MEILKPEILVIGGRHYRIDPIADLQRRTGGGDDADVEDVSERRNWDEDPADYLTNDEECDDVATGYASPSVVEDGDNDDDDDVEVDRKKPEIASASASGSSRFSTIQEFQDEVNNLIISRDRNDSTKFSTILHVPPLLHGFIIGFKGAILKELQTRFRVTIIIPRKNARNPTDVLITGDSETDVRRGARGVIRKVAQGRQMLANKPDPGLDSTRRRGPSHFTAFRLSPVDRAAFERIHGEFVESACGMLKGIDNPASLFTPSHSMHLTIGVLSALDAFEIDKASVLLREAVNANSNNTPSGSPPTVRLRGLKIFNDDPSQTSVIFTPPTNPPDYTGKASHSPLAKLQTLADAIFKRFASCSYSIFNGKTLARGGGVLFHATLINKSLYTGDDKLDDFDGTEIMKRFADIDFGAFIVDSVGMYSCNTCTATQFWKCDAKFDVRL